MVKPKIYYPNTVIQKMNIPFTVKLATTKSDPVIVEILRKVTKDIEADLEEVDQKFSPFKDSSLVSLYRKGDESPLIEDDMFQLVFAECELAKDETSGFFEPFHDKQYDPTGLVKGWAIQRAFQTHLKPLLVDPNIIGVSLNGGGDIQLGSKKNSSFEWNIGVENPDNTQEIIAEYQIKNGGIATSGMSKRGEHIDRVISPIEQVTVIANGLVKADIWATAGIAAGTDRFEELIHESKLTGMLVDSKSGITSFNGGKIHNAKEAQI